MKLYKLINFHLLLYCFFVVIKMHFASCYFTCGSYGKTPFSQHTSYIVRLTSVTIPL
jgi:hypothetical protein